MLKSKKPRDSANYDGYYGPFEELLDKDGQVKGAIGQWLGALLSKDWHLQPANDSPQALDVAAFTEKALGECLRFKLGLAALAMGKFYGNAEVEAVWGEERLLSYDQPQPATRGERRQSKPVTRPALIPAALLSRDPHRFRFDDENRLRLITANNQTTGELLPPLAIIVHTPDPRWSNPYGVGLGRTVWWWCKFKLDAAGWWIKFTEKMAAPTSVGKHPKGATAEEKAALKKVVTSIFNLTGVTVPEDQAIELLEAQKYGTINSFESLCQYCDEQIIKVVLGQTLSTQQGERGSQALGREHMEVRGEIVQRDAEDLCETLNQTLVAWIVEVNFGEAARGLYPRFTIETRQKVSRKEVLEGFKVASDLGVPLSLAQLREEAELEVPEDDNDTVKKPAPPSPFGPGSPLQPDGKQPQEESGVRSPESKDKKATAGIPGRIVARLASFPAGPLTAAEQLPAKDLTELRDEGVAATVKLTGRIPELVKQWVADQLAAAGIAGEDKVPPTGVFDWSAWALPEELRAELETRLNDDLTIGALYGLAEILDQAAVVSPAAVVNKIARGTVAAATAGQPISVSFAADDEEPRENPLIEALFGRKRIIPTRVLSVLNRKVRDGMEWDQFYQLDALARGASFTAWDLAEADIRHLGGALQDAANWGYTAQQFADYVYERLKPRYLTDGAELHAWHVETIYHTNLATAYNQAQADEIWELSDTIELFQVINPDPQFPRCREAAGQVWPTAMLRQVGCPPWHFGCGTTIAAMTRATAERENLWIESNPPVYPPEVYSGPGGVGTPQPFGAWAPMTERYEALAKARGEQ